MADTKEKVYCQDCKHFLQSLMIDLCDVLTDTYFAPGQPSMPNIKNSNNDCPDFDRKPAVCGPRDN